MQAHAPGEPPLGILGFGHFGRALGSLAAGAGMPWLACDPAAPVPAALAAASPRDLAARCRALVVCVPVPALEGVLADLRPALTAEHLVLDVGSVKAWPTEVMLRTLGPEIPWCATHPLFGPVSLSRGERPLRVVVCPNAQHPAAAGRARALYERLGCEVTELGADAHDRHMAETHALAFFVAKAMLDIDAGGSSEIVTPSFRALAQTVETVRADAGHLFSLIQLGNPYAAAARRRLLETLGAIDRELRESASQNAVGHTPGIDPAP
ncbi:MAG TPA: prephenate dehydrogenase/arogenate dehydrogenase family protein [Phycisphaerales bacterium]|nr:prephenate dehydrogenase/arogenate dehydrogenase family protein [Phycisphaerales bacterium]